VRCCQPAYTMELSASGTRIEDGRTYGQSDSRFNEGSNLVLTVHYAGAIPDQTELNVEWYVGTKPVSFFPTLRVPNQDGTWSRPYDNHTVEPGEYRVILKVNGRETFMLRFAVKAGG